MKIEPIEYLVTVNEDERYLIQKKRYFEEHWTIKAQYGNCVLSSDLEWVYDHSPSYQTEEFVKKTRFTVEEAIDVLKKWKEKQDGNT
jgi:hypothetical protein